MAITSASSIKSLLDKAPEDCFIVFKLSSNSTVFEAFSNAKEFYNYNLGLKPKNRNYYETVLEDIPQKPRFDVDIDRRKAPGSLDPVTVINDLIFAIMDVAAYYDQEIGFDDLLIYSSNGPNKYSYHIVIDHWYHENHHEARAFYNLVIDAMSERYSKYVDNSVYKSLQQFRIIGNTKKGEQRPKTRITEWKYNDSDITWELDSPYREFLRSLLTNTNNCKHLNIELDEKKYESGTEGDPKGSDVVDIDKILPFIPPGLTFDTFNKHGYRLKRTYPSKCLICKRIHDHENAYIKIEDGVIIYKCFRDLSIRHVLDIIEEKKVGREALLELTKGIMDHIKSKHEIINTPANPQCMNNIRERILQKRLKGC